MKKTITILFLIIAGWAIWSMLGRTHNWTRSDLFLTRMVSLANEDSVCSKNVVGIQPYMITEDYASELHFYKKMEGYFEEAKAAGFFKNNAIVVLPEYLGTWLVVSGEKKSVLEAENITGAMTTIVLSNPIKFIGSLFDDNGEKDKFAAAIFRMKSKEMARIYTNVFKKLANAYKVAINPGSIILPGAIVKNNEIAADVLQPLYNTSFIFKPDGTIDTQVVKKTFLIDSEFPFVQSYPIEKLPVYDLPVGKTAVLICADSWYPQSYEQINKLSPELVLIGSYCVGNGHMNSTWKGYNGSENPADVSKEDIGKLTEREAWLKYAMPGRLPNTKTPVGVNVFLRGELWDMGSDGNPFFVKKGEVQRVSDSEKAGIWSMCF